ALGGLALVESDDRARRVAALKRRDVEALDALRGVRQVQARAQLLRHALALPRGVAALGKSLSRVLARHLAERELVAPLRDEDRDALPAPLAQVLRADGRIRDGNRQQDLVRHVVVRRLVELRENGLEHLLVRELPVVERVAARGDELAAPHEEDL